MLLPIDVDDVDVDVDVEGVDVDVDVEDVDVDVDVDDVDDVDVDVEDVEASQHFTLQLGVSDAKVSTQFKPLKIFWNSNLQNHFPTP